MSSPKRAHRNGAPPLSENKRTTLGPHCGFVVGPGNEQGPSKTCEVHVHIFPPGMEVSRTGPQNRCQYILILIVGIDNKGPIFWLGLCTQDPLPEWRVHTRLEPSNIIINRAPNDHINIRILQHVISGIPLMLALGTRM